MTDTPLNMTKAKALELAIHAGGTPDEVVKRATQYHGFLNGAAPGSGGGGATAGATTGKPNGAATGATTAKTTAAPDKAAADKAAADKAAAAKVAADKAAKAATDKAAKPATAAAGATGAPIPPDTKAPGGTYSYGDMVDKLREVRQDPDLGKDYAIALMVKNGGAKSVRDMKPAKYDAVVAACNAALNGEGDTASAATGDVIDDGTGAPETDELGLPVG